MPHRQLIGRDSNSFFTAVRCSARNATPKCPPATIANGTSPMKGSPITSRRSMPIDNRLSELRKAVAKPLSHPDESDLRAAANEIVEWAIRHHSTLHEQSIGATATPNELRTI